MTGKPLFNDEIQVFSHRVLNRAYKIMKMMLQHFNQSQEQEVVVEKMRDNIIYFLKNIKQDVYELKDGKKVKLDMKKRVKIFRNQVKVICNIIQFDNQEVDSHAPLLESELMDLFYSFVKENSEENKVTHDAVITSFLWLLKSMCQHKADFTKELFDEGKIQMILDSLTARLPNHKNILPNLM
mmetsp:Transcript_8761/g.8075  ORF Transcript_8761/g.8075 Transcript_8761/m.8075 type:complete len:183 (-) Transcript_8761:284-832(-)